MSAPTQPGLLCLPGCQEIHGPDADECMAWAHVGTVRRFRTGRRLQVDCTAVTENGSRHGYVELYRAEDVTLDGFDLDPVAARALAALLIDAADKAERLIGAVPAQVGDAR